MSTDVPMAIGLGLGILLCLTVVLAITFVFYYFCCVKKRNTNKDDALLTEKFESSGCCPCMRKETAKIVKVKRYGNVLGVPKAPQTVGARNVTMDTVMVTWTPHIRDRHYGVNTYHVMCRSEDADWLEVGTTGGKVHQLKITGLDPRKSYFFSVAAESKFGTGPSTETAAVVVLQKQAPPDAPSRINCDTVGYEDITLSWHPPKTPENVTVDFYNVMMRVDKGGWKEVAKVTETQHTVSGLQVGKAYRFSVCANNSFGKSPAKELTNKMFVKNPVLPSPPIDLVVSEIKEDTIRIRWKQSNADGGSTITGYHVMIMEDNASWEEVDQVTTKAYTLTDLQPGCFYKFKVSAINNVGEGKAVETSNAVALKKILAVPKAPKEITIVDVQEASVTLSWRPPLQDGGSKVKTYRLQIKDESGAWSDLGHAWPLDMQYVAKDLQPGKTFTFQICAENKIGQGPFIQSKSVKVTSKNGGDASKIPSKIPDMPEGPMCVDYVTKKTALICWPPQKVKVVSQDLRLVLEYCDAKDKSATWMKADTIEPHVTEYLLKGLLPDAEYRVRLVAINNKGRSAALIAKETAKTLKPIKLSQPVSLHEFEDIARSMTSASSNLQDTYELTPLPPQSTLGRRYVS